MYKIGMEYDNYGKRYIVSEGTSEIGRIIREGGRYTAYLNNKYVGSYGNPYTAKNAIADTLYPELAEQRIKKQEEREKAADAKRTAVEEANKQRKEQHDAIVSTMNKMRESQPFRDAFYKAFCTVQPEYSTKTNDEIFSCCRIGMNGICLAIIDGEQSVIRSIKNGGIEGKIMKMLFDNGTILLLNGLEAVS